MKKFLFVLQIALLVIYIGTAQQKSGLIKNYQSKITDTGSKMYPIPGSHILNKYWKKDLEQLRAQQKLNADKTVLRKMNKVPFNFSVGDAREWYATNMDESSPNRMTEYPVPSTCRAVGSNCYIFVEDQLWTNGKVNQAAVESMRTAFEVRTPADASKGIYHLDVMYFGNPPDVDNDPKIIILILDIIDGYTSGGYVAGYFYQINEYPQSMMPPNRYSNEAEIYYIDGDPANLTTPDGVTAASSTTAHEFQHMIFFNYEDEDGKLTFINEGMSEIASKLCGYTLDSPGDYYSNTNVNFLSWDETGDIFEDYSRAAIFSWYLIEQFGTGVAESIVKNTFDGPACYTIAFNSVESDLNFTDVLKNFALAAQINNTAYDLRYGFTIPVSIKPSAVTHHFPVVSGLIDSVMPYGTRYIEFVSGQSISIDINVIDINSMGNIEIRAIATGTAGLKLDNITPGITYTLTDFGINYSNLVLAVTNLTNTKTLFTYSAAASGGSGSVELKYDLTEPTGYLSGSIGDTVCVWFSGVPGGRLDSVRVALQRAGTMTGGIWTYTGSVRPSPLGTPLAVPITAVVTQTPGIPYPEPWPNWGTIDLRANNIDASNAFAVAFIDKGNHTTEPRVMVTKSPIPDEITSLTYSTTSSAGPNWYYFTSNAAGDSVYTYLIRAYVSSYTTGVKQNTELTPASFTLEQNFPNPFNPSTTIRFQMPSKGLVALKVYDIIGREVITLVNGFKEAGMHEVKFNASGLPSGVYLYRITSGTFTQTRKLVFIK